MPKRPLTTRELEVLDTVLRSLDTELPIYRHTSPDGPNEWHLPCWAIPQSVEALGSVEVVDSELTDHIRFRRPRVTESEAEVTLEMPDEIRHFRLKHRPLSGWCVW